MLFRCCHGENPALYSISLNRRDSWISRLLLSRKNTGCGYSVEMPLHDISDEYWQHVMPQKPIQKGPLCHIWAVKAKVTLYICLRPSLSINP